MFWGINKWAFFVGVFGDRVGDISGKGGKLTFVLFSFARGVEKAGEGEGEMIGNSGKPGGRAEVVRILGIFGLTLGSRSGMFFSETSFIFLSNFLFFLSFWRKRFSCSFSQ